MRHTLERVDIEALVFPRQPARLQLRLQPTTLRVIRSDNAIRLSLTVKLLGNLEASLNFLEVLNVGASPQ